MINEPIRESFFVMNRVYANNNKFYHMIPYTPSKNEFTVLYGRIGKTQCQHTYCMQDWNNVCEKRYLHGYTNITDIYFSSVKNEVSAKKVVKKSVSETEKVMNSLYDYVNYFVKANYNFKSFSEASITSQMIEKADEIIKTLSEIRATDDEEYDVRRFNCFLSDLFSIVPRIIYDTTKVKAKSRQDFENIIKREADYLNTIRPFAVKKIKSNSLAVKNEKKDNDLIKNDIALVNLKLTLCNDKENSYLKDLMKEQGRRFVRAWSVKSDLDENFENWKNLHNSDTLTLFHGTKNENLYTILKMGLSCYPNAKITGKAFGDGIYFGIADKSVNYTSIYGSYWAHGSDDKAYLLVCELALGNTFECSGITNDCFKKDFHKKYDSLHAKRGNGLRRDEWVVYSDEQVRIKYLIEIGR